eukprot:m.372939 g.372939  ORF g.372939 m.372939 type:complete len:60 (+) comp65093_c0_seq1:1-180(+)
MSRTSISTYTLQTVGVRQKKPTRSTLYEHALTFACEQELVVACSWYVLDLRQFSNNRHN